MTAPHAGYAYSGRAAAAIEHGEWAGLYRGPVLRHSAGLIQAANFRSAVAF